MERDERGIDALSIFGIGLGVILLILGPGVGFYAIAMGWPW
jgi:hypothetical protein